jgi:KaiC/GvpD/RAD55 family RecA-like ATPase
LADNSRTGNAAVILFATIPASLAAIAGFYVAGPLAAAAAGFGGWLASYFLVEPLTRPTTETSKSVTLTLTAKPRKITDDDLRRAYGTPQVCWDIADVPMMLRQYNEVDFGPISFTYPVGKGITWEFNLYRHSEITFVVRTAGGDNLSQDKKVKLCNEVQIVAARQYQADARHARQRAEAARRTDMEEQMRRSAADERERNRVTAQIEAEKNAHREAQEKLRRIENEARDVRLTRLKTPVSLRLSEAGIVFGTKVQDGYDLVIPVRKIQHMLVGGVTGSGKSVFLHQMAYQLLRSDEVDRVVLIDLKGGTEFDRYRNEPKALVVWALSDVMKTFDELVAVLDAREAEMRANGLREWNGGRIFVIVDEYAEIHDSIQEARRGDEKEAAVRLANNLKRIIRRARSLGVRMICALQKATTDAMDSTLRANMDMRACFKVKTRQTAEATLDAFDNLPADPLTLSRGRFVFDNGRGDYAHLQAQISPGVELESD